LVEACVEIEASSVFSLAEIAEDEADAFERAAGDGEHACGGRE
jgi:hypothetical protein